jgi:carbon-monoxide dehydrogenase large subunit
MNNGIGERIPRKEDFRLLTGAGVFTDDYMLDGQTHGFVLRSPHGHAAIRSIDISDACTASGVLGVFTSEDYLADGMGAIPHVVNPPQIHNPKEPAFANRDDSPIFEAPHYPLAAAKVRHIGEGVAFIVAETLAQAKDAAERIIVDYHILPAVTDSVEAIKTGAPVIWDGAPHNIAFDAELGDEVATDAAFAHADHITELALRNNRITAVSMEPRAALAEYDAQSGVYTLLSGSQGVVRQQWTLMQMFDVPAEQMRVKCEDVGGGFGMRNWVFPEFVLALWAARRLGRPVKWVSDRSEAFVSDYQARDLITRASLALSRDGRFLGLRIYHLGNIGGNLVSFVPLANGVRIVTSIYDLPAAYLQVRGVITNTVPTAPYRGAGRPETMFIIERLIERAAAEMGIDRVQLRRLNLIPPSKLPYTNPMGVIYDTGAFHDNMEQALRMAGWDDFLARRAEAARRGKLRGIGLSNYVETPVGWPQERCEIEVRPDGQVDMILGTQNHGQGHETTFAQVMVDQLGVPFESVNLITGDTAIVKEGGGTHSDRSMRLAGALMVWVSEKIIKKGMPIAAHLLEAADEDVEFVTGRFTVTGTDRSLGIFEVAAAAIGDDVPEALRGTLAADHEIWHRLPAYPTGCAIAEVEIDPEIGEISLENWTALDDVGRVINPMIVEGQVHGGIAQGVGQVFWEENVYDATGQLVAGSFMDYCMPRADNLPFFNIDTTEAALTKSNPLGVKGGGEAGTTPSLGAAVNAVMDALRDFDTGELDMPLTPQRLWQAMQRAGKDNRTIQKER